MHKMNVFKTLVYLFFSRVSIMLMQQLHKYHKLSINTIYIYYEQISIM